MERESLLRQANHMWKMLDNMAENNPDDYQRFIKKQLQEGSVHFKPPEPVFCLSCKIEKAASTNTTLFINICQWGKVPKPKTDNDPIPVKGGKLRQLDQTSQVYDVAFNPTIIEECAQQDVYEQLLQLILDYTVDMTKVTLKRSSCKKLNKKFVGSLQDIISSIDEHRQSSMNHNSSFSTDHPQSLLEQLANINKETEQEPDIVLPTTEPARTTTLNKKLIEEIPPTCDKNTLRYDIDSGKEKLTVSIEVGRDVDNIADAELDVSENELELKIPGIPNSLVVQLPHTVDKDKVIAKYLLKSGKLCVTMEYK